MDVRWREHDVRVDVTVRRADTRDAHRAIAVSRPVARDRHPVAQLDTIGPKRCVAQRPLEGRSPAAQHDEVLVTRFGRSVLDGRHQHVAPRDLGGAGLEQFVADIREPVAQEVTHPREKGMRVANLRRAATPPVEGFVRGLGKRRRVALEQDDVVRLAAEGESRTQPGHAGTNDGHAHRGPSLNSTRCDRSAHRCGSARPDAVLLLTPT